MKQNNSNLYLDPRAKFIFLPYLYIHSGAQSIWKDLHMQFKELLKSNNKLFIDIRDFLDLVQCYSDYFNNWHHFTLQTQYDLIIPKINELLQFGYDKNDFELIPYFDGDIDLSYLKPKKEFKFLVLSTDKYGGTDDNSIKSGIYYGNFDILMGINETTTMEFSKYHHLYKFPHRSSTIINLTTNSNRVLLLSGDSQNIPQLPILACYFKLIVYLDRRHLNSGIDYSNIQFTDILFSLFDMSPIEKYIYNNLVITKNEEN